MKLLLLVAALAVPMFAADEFPAGPGKDLVTDRCAGCHGLDVVTGHRDSAKGWGDLVDYMASRGMTATDDEMKAIVDYLTKSFPKPDKKDDGKGKSNAKEK
jgi:mono/diheme cytochrome c family protein